MSLENAIIAIIIMSLITFFTRATPFIFFKDKNPPELIQYIQQYIPPMIMVILVIYCLKDIRFFSKPYGIPEMVAILFIVIMHVWKKNPLLSILGGTIIYMVLIQTDILAQLFR